MVADGLVAFCLVGVAADDEPVAHHCVVDDDFFDLEVVGDGVVAALAGQRRGGFGGAAAEFLTDDVVPAGSLQVAAVLRRGEPAIGDPHDPAQLPGAQVVFDFTDQG